MYSGKASVAFFALLIGLGSAYYLRSEGDNNVYVFNGDVKVRGSNHVSGKIYLRSPQKDIELSEVLENGRALLATSSELTLAFRNSSAFPFERELDDLNDTMSIWHQIQSTPAEDPDIASFVRRLEAHTTNKINLLSTLLPQPLRLVSTNGDAHSLVRYSIMRNPKDSLLPFDAKKRDVLETATAMTENAMFLEDHQQRLAVLTKEEISSSLKAINISFDPESIAEVIVYRCAETIEAGSSMPSAVKLCYSVVGRNSGNFSMASGMMLKNTTDIRLMVESFVDDTLNVSVVAVTLDNNTLVAHQCELSYTMGKPNDIIAHCAENNISYSLGNCSVLDGDVISTLAPYERNASKSMEYVFRSSKGICSIDLNNNASARLLFPVNSTVLPNDDVDNDVRVLKVFHVGRSFMHLVAAYNDGQVRVLELDLQIEERWNISSAFHVSGTNPSGESSYNNVGMSAVVSSLDSRSSEMRYVRSTLGETNDIGAVVYWIRKLMTHDDGTGELKYTLREFAAIVPVDLATSNIVAGRLWSMASGRQESDVHNEVIQLPDVPLEASLFDLCESVSELAENSNYIG